jgi:hypothetical protein
LRAKEESEVSERVVPVDELEWIADQYDDRQTPYVLAARLYDVSCTAKKLIAAAPAESASVTPADTPTPEPAIVCGHGNVSMEYCQDLQRRLTAALKEVERLTRGQHIDYDERLLRRSEQAEAALKAERNNALEEAAKIAITTLRRKLDECPKDCNANKAWAYAYAKGGNEMSEDIFKAIQSLKEPRHD